MVDLWRNFFGYRISHFARSQIFTMSQPNYKFGLKCIYVRQEINLELNQFARRIETLLKFHSEFAYQDRFKAFDVVHWSQIPISQLKLLEDYGHPWGQKLFNLCREVNEFHYSLKRELEEEIFWVNTIESFDSKISPKRDELEKLVRELFSTPGYVLESTSEALLHFMSDRLQCQTPKLVFGQGNRFASQVMSLLDRFFAPARSIALADLSKTLGELFESNRDELKTAFEGIKKGSQNVSFASEFATQNANARAEVHAKHGNEGFTVNEYNVNGYINSLKLLGAYLEFISSELREIDITREEDRFLITVQEAADYFYSLGVAGEDDGKEAGVQAERKKMQGNSKRGLLAGLRSPKEILPVLSFAPKKGPRPQKGYCVYELFEKLCPAFFKKSERDDFLQNMYSRVAKRNS